MNQRQLEIFITLANTLNFRKTAEQMYLSQTTVSFQIHSLEDELGVRLFNRDTRTVKLTEAGSIFYDYAKRALVELDDGIHMISIFKNGYSELLTIGVAVDTNTIGLSEIIKKFRSIYPKIEIRYQSDYPRGLLEELREGNYDIVIVPYSNLLKSKNFSCLKLGTFESIAAFHRTHPFADKEQLTWKDFQNTPFLCVSDDLNELDFSNEFLDKCRKHKVYPDIKMKTDNIDSILLMLETGIGFTIIPAYFESRLQGNTHIITRSTDLGLTGTTLYAVWKASADNRIITSFTTMLKTHILTN